jgi:magnesium-transporting ATPase (P-type)
LRTTVEGECLAPGDVVLLEAGDKVPADLRIIEARGLAAQEAILTGESVPVEKGTTAVAIEAPLGDRRSMLWSGTLVTQGTARGLVVATGVSTEIGRIGGLLAEVEQLTTPLVAKMDEFARWLSALILVVAGLLLVYGYFVGHHEFGELFMVVVGVAVAAIPEGLPAVMTITLAIGVQAMARRNAIVRRLPAIEAIGSVSVICSDKTGTLSRNEMVVAAAETVAGSFRIQGEGYAPVGSTRSPSMRGTATWRCWSRATWVAVPTSRARRNACCPCAVPSTRRPGSDGRTLWPSGACGCWRLPGGRRQAGTSTRLCSRAGWVFSVSSD